MAHYVFNGKKSGPKKNASAYEQDGEVAREIAAVVPYYPFKGIPRFYDIGGFLERPDIFQKVIDSYVQRYRNMDIDSIGGFDARGFVLGPPIAMALNKPFFMLRKPGKMPNTVSSSTYSVEYGEREGMCISRGSVKKGDRVLLIDDLVSVCGETGPAKRPNSCPCRLPLAAHCLLALS